MGDFWVDGPVSNSTALTQISVGSKMARLSKTTATITTMKKGWDNFYSKNLLGIYLKCKLSGCPAFYLATLHGNDQQTIKKAESRYSKLGIRYVHNRTLEEFLQVKGTQYPDEACRRVRVESRHLSHGKQDTYRGNAASLWENKETRFLDSGEYSL